MRPTSVLRCRDLGGDGGFAWRDSLLGAWLASAIGQIQFSRERFALGRNQWVSSAPRFQLFGRSLRDRESGRLFRLADVFKWREPGHAKRPRQSSSLRLVSGVISASR